MKITVIAGSQRPGSQSEKVARYLTARLRALDCDVDVLTIHDLGLSAMMGEVWSDEAQQELVSDVKTRLAAAEGYLIVTPEWHGMASPGLKNMLLHVGTTMAHKAAMLVGVSATYGGSYPLAEIRSAVSKNTRICFVPEQIIIRKVKTVLNDDVDESNDADAYLRDRIEWALPILLEYTKALAPVRESGVTESEAYDFGM
ncbi:NADPH-dependent FMN reductase [Euzebya tangerina]|uniref:NADPH-dependent FMN reductase n=1 Tax=Euzebya tangerina TaxID=591198 RepID=UPI000E31D240|nr:NAD(P)H-dependent oxidoreductase [Euzebya tangerina]